jgi:hypothetical protein
MKMNTAATELEIRAAEALAAVLAQISGVKLKGMRREPASRDLAGGFLAQIDVFGHSHTLACEVRTNAEPSHLREALRDFHSGSPHLPGDATPIIIAPYLSPEAQALCKESHTGFLDLEGNARLSVGELFISMRSLPCRATSRLSVASPKPPARSLAGSGVHGGLPKLPQNRAPVALTA